MHLFQAQALAGTPHGYTLDRQVGNTRYEESVKTESTPIEYTYVKNINYVPATYKWVEGKLENGSSTDRLQKPAFEGTSYGQISGCWEWTK